MEIKISNYEILLIVIALGGLAFVGFLILCFFREPILEKFSNLASFQGSYSGRKARHPESEFPCG